MTSNSKTQQELEQWIHLWEKAHGCRVIRISYDGQGLEPEAAVVIIQLGERCAMCGNEMLPLRALENGLTCSLERSSGCCTNGVCSRYRLEVVSLLRIEKSRAVVERANTPKQV